MSNLNFRHIFQNAFDTFKVFETIPLEIVGTLVAGQTTTIWQTLNHLTLWRAYHIQKLKDTSSQVEFNEAASWISESAPKDIAEWQAKTEEFHQQTKQLEGIITILHASDPQLEEKFKILHESSTNLSFHLGEIILIARQQGKYPQPYEMAEFLKD